MRRLVGRERPGRVAILQQQVADHDRVSHVARIVVRQPLQLVVSLIPLLHLHVELVFLHRERLVDAQRILQLIEAVDGLTRLASLIEGLGQVIDQLRLSRMLVHQLTIELGSLAIHTHIERERSQRQAIGVVRRIVLHGTPEIVERELRFAQLQGVDGQLIERRRGRGVKADAVTEVVVSDVVSSGLLVFEPLEIVVVHLALLLLGLDLLIVGPPYGHNKGGAEHGRNQSIYRFHRHCGAASLFIYLCVQIRRCRARSRRAPPRAAIPRAHSAPRPSARCARHHRP